MTLALPSVGCFPHALKTFVVEYKPFMAPPSRSETAASPGVSTRVGGYSLKTLKRAIVASTAPSIAAVMHAFWNRASSPSGRQATSAASASMHNPLRFLTSLCMTLALPLAGCFSLALKVLKAEYKRLCLPCSRSQRVVLSRVKALIAESALKTLKRARHRSVTSSATPVMHAFPEYASGLGRPMQRLLSSAAVAHRDHPAGKAISHRNHRENFSQVLINKIV
jgi:hypothetical protein